jgi:hypothetical protein
MRRFDSDGRITATRTARRRWPYPPTKEDYRDRYEELTGHSLKTCPACHEGEMIVIETLRRTTIRPPIVDTS